LLLRGSSVTERLRVAGNADWQEKRVPRCWPSVNGRTSGLEYGVGNLLPSTAKSSTLGSLSGPPQCRLKGNLRESVHLSGASGTRQIPGSPIVRHCRALGASPLPRPLAGIRSSRGAITTRFGAVGFPMVPPQPPCVPFLFYLSYSPCPATSSPYPRCLKRFVMIRIAVRLAAAGENSGGGRSQTVTDFYGKSIRAPNSTARLFIVLLLPKPTYAET
jgi:hypothetical protein